MNKPLILSIGEVLWDLFPEGAKFGGAPANFACHATALGGRVCMVSAVGDDPLGEAVLEILTAHGVDTSLVRQIADAPTGEVGVSLDSSGKPTFTIHEGSAWDRLVWTPELEMRLAEADAVYFGTLCQRGELSRATIRQALDVAARRGCRRVLDVNLRRPFFDAELIRESVAKATVLKLSDDELEQVAAACGIDPQGTPDMILRGLLERHRLELVAMTRGPAGALLVSPTEIIDQPGIRVVVRDTVGAGDSFTAALVIGLLRGDPLAVIARVACEIAAAVCARSGAVPELPASSKT